MGAGRREEDHRSGAGRARDPGPAGPVRAFAGLPVAHRQLFFRLAPLPLPALTVTSLGSRFRRRDLGLTPSCPVCMTGHERALVISTDASMDLQQLSECMKERNLRGHWEHSE